MSRIVEKVTGFITRWSNEGYDLLLFEHPYAGIQIPAGTVKDGESPEQAVLREVAEETGLVLPSIHRYLGCAEDVLPEGHKVIAERTRVYARPDLMSFNWAYLRKGIPVTLSRRSGGFSHVTYQEWDRWPDPQYVTMCISGWVPDDALGDTRMRHFFHLEFHGRSEKSWKVFSDNHFFSLFWAPLDALPEIVYPQNEWLAFLYELFCLPAASE